jgi:PAS domain S-box-containing protein
MEPPPDHPQGQDTELERLRTELREAQDILDAIRSGQVDALVLSKPEGRSVLTLQGTEHPYRLTVEAMSEGAVTLAADGTLLFCNPRFLEMTKTTREQALGMDFRDFLGPKDRGTIDRLAQSQTAGIARIRLGLRARDGSERPVYLTARELRTEALRCFVLVVTDLSEIARGEEALRQSEARSRALIEGTSDIIAVCATDGTLRYVSPAVMAVGGYEPQALIGTPFQALLHPDDLPLAARALQDIVLHPDFIQHFEARYRHKNGTWVVLESLSRNLTADPAVGGIVVTLRDVTERKRIEQTQRNRTQRLQTQAEALDRIASAPALAGGDVESLAREITERAAQATGVERANVWLFNEAETELHCIDLYEASAGLHSAGMVLAEEQFRNEFHALKAAPYVNADDPLTDSRTRGYVESYLKPLGITSMLDAVVESGDRHLGLLCLEHVGRPHHWEDDEIEFACRLADKIALALGAREARQARERVQAGLEQAIRALAGVVEIRDPYTAGHQRRVAGLAVAVARELGLSEDRIHGLDLAAAIHDIGKIQVPADILNKPGKLSAAEHQLLRVHAQAGYDIVKDVEFPWPIAEMILQHHERLDGSGYPRGLKGDQILPEARILAVADVMESMASHRPYRAALGVEAALTELVGRRGTSFDADAVDACVKLFREKSYQLPSVWPEREREREREYKSKMGQVKL